MNSDKFKNLPPTKLENVLGKLLIFVGIVTAIVFINWLVDPKFVGYRPLYYVLMATFFYKILRLIIEWALCFHLSVPPKPKSTRNYTVDILTTYCQPEPKEMTIRTLRAIQKITYPHNTFLCDEANDEELKQICKELNITHVTRKIKVNAKAGNINNALNTVANGEICLILDPDHIPYPNFLDEVLPYFEDEKVGYVQVVQAYYNHQDTVIAKAAAQQTYQFYGPFMMGLNTYGAVPAIGANCTFRRKALDSIGGHAPGLTEDMHTSMLLHSKGWKSVYNPVIVAKGLVPWNYSGYCLQQLKWARGSFDLLFNVLPGIFTKISWKQLLYYLAVPFFYLSGLMAIIDFLIPVIALFSGVVPIKISLVTFFQYYLPLFVATIAIRQFNQRWLLEQHEKGAFIFGGTLFKTSWWAFVLGFFYSLINKKVPYIPTPKGFEYETPLKLLIPNFIIITISAVAIVYGLSRDFNPFLMFMAVLASINIIILSLGSVMAVQHLIIAVHKVFKGTFITKGSKTRKWVYQQNQRVYSTLQVASLPIVIFTLLALLSLNKYEERQIEALRMGAHSNRVFFVPDIKGSSMYTSDRQQDFIYKEFAVDAKFLPEAISFADFCQSRGKMPYYNLHFSKQQLYGDWNLLDTVFENLFLYLRQSYAPVMFGVTTDNLKSDKIFLAYKLNHLTAIATRVSFPNIAWVWYSEEPYTDTLVEINKYSLAWIKTEHQYYSPDLRTEIPLLLEYESTIRSVKPSEKARFRYSNELFNTPVTKAHHNRSFDIDYIKGVAYNPGHDWRDNNIALPLTIDKLREDFNNIKEMGANTIRRYSPSIYDRNILKVANETELQVLYGFWFDPKVNYATQKSRIRKYEREVLRTVRRYKDNPAIMGWTLGNETWGLLKLNYNEPYLSIVRKEYVKMIADLAQKVKQIDPTRPVFVAEEHTPHLSSAFYAFSTYAPDVDFYGVNTYYHQNISLLDSVMTSINLDGRYLVAEFGPKGYWHHEYNDYIYDTLRYEHSSFSKAEDFKYQWEHYIYGNKERNIGGIAFCWQDRFEGTATWFGMTDIFGNKKPSWYALKSVFTSDTAALETFPISHFHMLMPKELFQGNTHSVIAATQDIGARDQFFYRWMIYEEETFRLIEETPFIKGQYRFYFKPPKRKSSYRLYLYVTDNLGNVITESSPILLRWY
jgi:cellulose synthase/poly-beta-1,6-N-acetylglucosamine synthase-like glycosyltransferase